MTVMTLDQIGLLNRMNGTANRIQLGTLLAGLFPLEVSGTLTQAQLISMFTTPVSLLAAPAAGFITIVDSVQFKHVYATAAYTGGGIVSLAYADGTAIVAAAATLVTGASSEERYIVPSVAQLDATTGTGKGLSLAQSAAQAVVIKNATAVFAAGNAANVLEYKIRYKTIQLLP